MLLHITHFMFTFLHLPFIISIISIVIIDAV